MRPLPGPAPPMMRLAPSAPRRPIGAPSTGRTWAQGRSNGPPPPSSAPPPPTPPPASQEGGRGAAEQPPSPRPTPPRPKPGRARSAADARLRRTPLPAKPASATSPPLLEILGENGPLSPPPPVDVPATADADSSLYEVEPEVLPVDPAAIAAARAAAAAGEGSAVTFFAETAPLPSPPSLVVAAESTPVERGAAALEARPGGTPPVAPAADPDAPLRGLSEAEVDARTATLVALATAGDRFEAVLGAVGPSLDAATLRLLERRITALRITASSPTDEAGLQTLTLLLARLRAEVARLNAPPVEQALDEALRLVMVAEANGARTAIPPHPSSSRSSPPSSARRLKTAAARAFLETVVSTGAFGRGRAGPDPLAAEVAAALAAVEAGTAPGAAPPPPPPVWLGEPIPPADLVSAATALVQAARAQVAALRAAPASAPAVAARLAEREALLGALVELAGVCRELSEK